MCPMLRVCWSKYYAWRELSRLSPRARSDRCILVLIRSLYPEWNRILGYRHICIPSQQDHGESIGIRRVRPLMRRAGLSGVPKKQRPNQAWGTDITEFRTGEGELYLYVIKNLDDGTVMSWKAQARPTADLVIATVEWAVVKSSRQDGKLTTLYSDHGCQYTNNAFQKRLRLYGLRMSMGPVRT